MHSIRAVFDALDAAVATIGELDFTAADPMTRLRALERQETARRRQLVAGHDLLAGLAHEDPADVGGPAVRWCVTCPQTRRPTLSKALVRRQLGDPKRGVHNGLPVTVVVSTTLKELSSAAGRAVTGGGTLLPMRNLIRMASRAYHYLAVLDDHQNRPLYLGRARRIASADQRLVLYPSITPTTGLAAASPTSTG